jgi:hypothetical protein
LGPTWQESVLHHDDVAPDDYLYVLDGDLRLGDETLAAGDAAKLAGPEELPLTGAVDAELILVDVPLRFRPIGLWA